MAKQLKIGLIQAFNELDVQWHRPLFFGYLKAYADKYLDNGVDIQFIEKPEHFEGFDIVGISSTSQDFSRATELARTFKKTDNKTIIIIGGHHITYLPETLTEEYDLGIMGEGEETFLELVRYFLDHGPRLKKEELKKIKGIVFRDNGHIIITEKRDLISPLDKIPFPYRAEDSAPYIFSSRGCPYKCSFCSSAAFWKKTRFYSAEYVVREVEHILERYPDIQNITIWDDIFIADKGRFNKFVELVDEKGINKRVPFTFTVRANLVDDKLCGLLKRINVSAVGFGAESGSDRILKLLNKGATVEINQKALDTLYNHGIRAGCSFIVGAPGETESEVRSTYEFAIKNILEGKLGPDCPVNIMMPLPGTELWDNALKSGILDISRMEWKRLSVFASYRHSKINNFKTWVEYRRKNNSVYLAEDTLPQERLYELMYFYEGIISALEKNRELQEKEGMLTSVLQSKTWQLTAPIRQAISLIRGKYNV